MFTMNAFSLRIKLLILGIVLPVLLLGTLFFLYAGFSRQEAVADFVDKARAICLQTEAVREDMEKKWELGLFSLPMLQGFAAKKEMDKLINSVPIVTAWKTAMAKSEAGNFTFKVPKIQPRNPANQPDPLELRALQALEQKNLPEYYEVDHEKNQVRYFLPVKLSANCLYCHGDPALSEQFWGNKDGKDPYGATMENWKAGEVHGAFEVLLSLDPSDRELAANLQKAGLVSGGGLLLIFIIASLFIRAIANPLLEMASAAREMARGDMFQTVTHAGSDEIGVLADSFRGLLSAQQKKIALAQAVAAGDLTAKPEIVSDKDLLGISLEKMLENLNIIAKGYEIAQQVSSNADQISDASQSLSQGATESAASIEQVSASLTEISAQTKTNAENASMASSLAKQAQNSAEKGNEQMTQMIGAMNEIQQSSLQIGKIIKVIDEIAFQTNLLALNAAVEAARAGTHGKGFAVVADEVRNLANRSAQAAKETNTMIESSQKKVENGVSLAKQTEESLKQIVQNSSKMAGLVGEIASASNEQAEGVSQVQIGITQIDTVTQQNSANAEETAASSVELSSRAQDLNTLLSRFKLKK